MRRPEQIAWVELAAAPFDLEKTLASGQVFHWEVVAPRVWRGTIHRAIIYLRQREPGGVLETGRGMEELCCHYFALDHPLEEIYATFPPDAAMQEALAFCRGVRILRQPLWECLATFITSAMKQVSHITAISHRLRQRFGSPLAEGLHAYPTPEQLARVSEADLRACGLGFRALNLRETARLLADGDVDLERFRQLDDETALQRLCLLPGVGPKIANCVLLFGYERVRAFPIDVWIERVLRRYYFSEAGRRPTLRQLQEFAAEHFGPYGGYAQQYLFHHARSQPRSLWAKPKKGVSSGRS